MDIGCRATGHATLGGSSKELRVLDATLAVPRATCRHSVEAGAEYVAQLFAAVAEHELGGIAKLVADHACVVAAIVF
jgi:hypothetical protein